MSNSPLDPDLEAPPAEPRTVVVPVSTLGTAPSISVSRANIPSRLVGGDGVAVYHHGLDYILGLDIAPLQIANGSTAKQWLPVWQEGTPIDEIARVAVNAIPNDAPSDSTAYGRQNGGWVPIDDVEGPPGPMGPAGPPGAAGSGLSQETADTLYVNLTGDQMFGPLTLPSSGSVESATLSFGSPSVGLIGNASAVMVITAGQVRFGVSAVSVTSTLPVVLPGDPTADLQAATKQYVDNMGGGVDAYTKVESDSRYAPTAHSHAIAEVTDLQTTLNAKAPVATISTAAPSGGVDGDVWYKVS